MCLDLNKYIQLYIISIHNINILCIYLLCTDQRDRNLIPFFQCSAVLAIPNIVLQPALDEVQGAVTKSAHSIVQVASGVSQWNKDRVKAKINSRKNENSSHGT